MSSQFTITREIGIDAGHRIMDHGSKCRNLHGHRYTVQAQCIGPALHHVGAQSGMLLDFGFLKEEMMKIIDARCDHGMILYALDPMLKTIAMGAGAQEDALARACDLAMKRGSYAMADACGLGNMKLYIVNFTPTAENLAKHWYEELAPRVLHRSSAKASLAQVRVWETPNCMASYPA